MPWYRVSYKVDVVKRTDREVVTIEASDEHAAYDLIYNRALRRFSGVNPRYDERFHELVEFEAAELEGDELAAQEAKADRERQEAAGQACLSLEG